MSQARAIISPEVFSLLYQCACRHESLKSHLKVTLPIFDGGGLIKDLQYKGVHYSNWQPTIPDSRALDRLEKNQKTVV